MTSYYQDVVNWHRHFGVPAPSQPTPLTDERISLRINLMAEEWGELTDELIAAIGNAPHDLAAVAKEGADLVVTVLGTMAEAGIPFDQVWAAVHASNMAKRGPDGQVIRRADGKILKPPGWQPPDIANVLAAAAGEWPDHPTVDPFTNPVCHRLDPDNATCSPGDCPCTQPVVIPAQHLPLLTDALTTLWAYSPDQRQHIADLARDAGLRPDDPDEDDDPAPRTFGPGSAR